MYQINFTTRVGFKSLRPGWELFSSLVRRHPVPYAAFLNMGSEQIVSLSPQLFFEMKGSGMTVRPMKETAPCGRTLEHDLGCAAELRASEKNRTKNAMIVDLMRSDLAGLVAQALSSP